MSNKTRIEQGLNGLLATTAQQEQENEQEQEKGRKTETICYNLDPDIIENVRRIAKYEGKRANAVVTEALRMYFAQWVPVPQEKPTLL